MNSYERVMALFKNQIPDRVPVFEWAVDKKVIESICPGGDLSDLVEEADLDAIVVAQDETKDWIDANTYKDEWGVVKRSTGQAYSMEISHPIHCREELDSYSPPSPEASHRFDSLKQVVRRFKGKKAIIIKLRDVLSQPRDLIGFEDLLVNCILDPELVRKLIEISVGYYGRLGSIAVELGADIIHTGDDIADNSGPLVSPELYSDIFYPPFKRLVSQFKSTGAPYIKHTDGNIYPIIELLVDSGLDMLDPIDPLAGMDIAEVKRKYGRRIAIKGNIDCAGVLQYGTEADVAHAVRECIKVASPGGGYVLSSSNSIHSGIPPGNFLSMIRAAHKFGTYPL